MLNRIFFYFYTMKTQIIQKQKIIPTVWDGGETFEYFIYPNGSKYSERNFLFRISAATIRKAPSNFTRFENYKRFLVMLDNKLQITRNSQKEEYKKLEVFKFDSSDEIVSHSTGNDFNLMISKKVNFSSVQFTDSVVMSHQFVFLFAVESIQIWLSEKKINLNPNDLLLIESTYLVKIKSNKPFIAAFINL